MIKNREQLKSVWITGYVPTQQDFQDLFDSYPNVNDGTIEEITLGNLQDLGTNTGNAKYLITDSYIAPEGIFISFTNGIPSSQVDIKRSTPSHGSISIDGGNGSGTFHVEATFAGQTEPA